MSILSSLKSTFLPDAQTAAARRKKVFGTENKAIAGAVIVGTAAAAIAAPVVAAAPVVRTAAASVGKTIVTNPIKSTIAASVAAPIIAGTVVRDPTTVTRAPASFANFEKNLYSVAKDPSKENVAKLYSENPLISGGLTAAGLIAAGKGAVGAASLLSNVSTAAKLEKAANTVSAGVPTPYALSPAASAGTASVLPTGGASSAVSSSPILPQTQALRSVRSGVPARRKRRPQIQQQRQSMRVQIINAKYIRGYAH